MGIVGTIGIFWSLSGFILKVIQSSKNIYLNGTNLFVLRQLNNKINTTVISMSIICLMLFMTISILSSCLSLQSVMSKELEEMTPVDVNLYKTANLPESYENHYTGQTVYYTEEQREDSQKPVSYTLETNGYDMNQLKDITEIPIYAIPEWTWQVTFGDYFETAKQQYSMLAYNTVESIIKVSDYNKIASLYGLETYEIEKADEYIILCDFDSMKEIRDDALKANATIEINGTSLHPKYNECKSGYIYMSTSHSNTGIILVSDDFDLKEEWKEQYFLAANFNAETEEEKEEINKTFTEDNSKLYENLTEKGIQLDGMTKIVIIESSKGITAIIIFIAIYLGIIFLIASAAILALKQLTESSDNKQRYMILRKIGCDEKMINQALFRQILIFFLLPLLLAIIHSIFGIQFVLSAMVVVAKTEELLPSIIVTAIIIGVVYGLYFLATYLGSKNIIKEEE